MAIPLLIHWWRSREGKELLIPSIRFLEKDAKSVARKKKLQDLLLLALRCAMMVLAAFWLATPLFLPKPPGSKGKGWVLVGDGLAINEMQPLLDSLVKEGFEARHFRKGFELLEKKPIAKDSIPYFALLDAADRLLPEEKALFVITDDERKKFGNSKPALQHQVTWRLLSTDTAAAPATTGGMAPDATTPSELPRNIAVMGDKRDVAYVTAALEALKQSVYPQLSVQTSVTDSVDWLFWLQTGPLPEKMAAKKVFRYDTSAAVNVHSWIRGTGITGGQPALYRKTTGSGTGQVLWRDGSGQPLLWSVRPRQWQFSSRFDPAWNNLVWSSGFPQWLLQMMAPDAVLAAAANNMLADELTHFPVYTAKAAFVREAKPLNNNWWIAALLLLFAIERYIAHRKNSFA